ncbi:MAG: DUF1800 family protein [Planctomycetota bacterium]
MDPLRFLTQATFGPDPAGLTRLLQVGYPAWLADQIAMPPTLHRPALQDLGQAQPSDRQAIWWERVLTAPDQLRQRVAFALSEILVVSDVADALVGDVCGVAEYYDILVRGAFGTYRELLEHVTLSPIMGRYLSHLRNARPDPIANTRPDENYAREIMQLFSVGLWELDQNGQRMLDNAGQPIPTYHQPDIVALANVFTGWNYHGAFGWFDYNANYLPMEPWEAFHDQQAKLVLGEPFPAGQLTTPELVHALDTITEHLNVGPFLGRQLIQRLVTSNPSPAYVGRVAAVWADDGAGVRGNLGAVVSAILLDPEARTGHLTNPDFGKIREPLLMQTALWRAFGATTPSGAYTFTNPDYVFAQAALRARTVFNFFRPDYAPPGPITQAGLHAPEAQILDHSTAITTVNRWYSVAFEQGSINIDLTLLTAFATDINGLLDYLDAALLMGSMSGSLRSILTSHLQQISNPDLRAMDAIYLVAASPEFFVQR